MRFWKSIFFSLLWIQIQALEPAYQKYTCSANPLYSPWLCDPLFLEINSRYADGRSALFREYRYIQYSLARHAVSLEGDFVEFGVYSGKGLDILASVLDRFDSQGRTLFGFDSFAGWGKPAPED